MSVSNLPGHRGARLGWSWMQPRRTVANRGAALAVSLSLAASGTVHAGGDTRDWQAAHSERAAERIGGVVPPPAQAVAAPREAVDDGNSKWPDTETVNDLLRAETGAAALAHLQRMRSAVAVPRLRDGAGRLHSGVPVQRVDVAAIYGVGKRLSVELLVNGRRARYRHGRKWPDSAPAGGAGVYALSSIDGPCVRLVADEGPSTACLEFSAVHMAKE